MKLMPLSLFLSCALFAVNALGEDETVPVSPVRDASDGAIVIPTDGGAAITGIPSVSKRIAALFEESDPPVQLTQNAFKEMSPDFVIIPGSDEKSTLIYRFRYINPESVVDALESVISDAGTVEVLKEQGNSNIEINKIVINDLSSKMTELKNVLIALD